MTVYETIQSSACGCDDPDLLLPLMSVPAALQAGLALATPVVELDEVALHQARGRVLARPVCALADMPGFDNSGMDGYALRCADIGPDIAPILPVQDEVSAAGGAVSTLKPGHAMRIYTGAPIPQGADAVVMQERAPRNGDAIHLLQTPKPDENIRRQGEDLMRGAPVLEPGQILSPKAIAACAGAGVGQVTVFRPLRVALVLTGDELTPAGEPLTGGAIWDVNTPMLNSLIACDWAEVTQVCQVVDERAALAAALDELADTVDLIVTSGGVSVGDRDHVKPALEGLGARVTVSGVAIKPGKPITLSALRRAIVVSLPGNPVSAFVTWHVFGAPIAARMAGLAQPRTLRRHVRADADLRHKTGRCEYRPATIAGYGSDGVEVVTSGARTHSAQLAPLARADGLVLIPAETECLNKGDLIEFLPFPA